MIDQKVKFLFQISQPTNIPKKWFSTQNAPLGGRFQMKLTLTIDSVFFSPKIKSPHGWGQSHLKPDIQRFVLSTEPFLRDICGLRYLKKKSDLLVNH